MGHEQIPWKDAIKKVLIEAGAALHYKDIAEHIVNQKLRTDVGATPSKTVNRCLNKEAQKGIFEKVAEGTFRIRGSSYLDNGRDNLDYDSNRPIVGLGMYWDRNLVDWANNPKILGVELYGSDPVDMADQTGIYLLYDFRKIVYVGRAMDSNLGSRLLSHTRNRLKTRWNRFSWFGFRAVKADGTLDRVSDNYEIRDVVSSMEALLIEALEPPQNRRGGDGFQGIEYVQVQDPKTTKVKLLSEINHLFQSK